MKDLTLGTLEKTILEVMELVFEPLQPLHVCTVASSGPWRVGGEKAELGLSVCLGPLG